MFLCYSIHTLLPWLPLSFAVSLVMVCGYVACTLAQTTAKTRLVVGMPPGRKPPAPAARKAPAKKAPAAAARGTAAAKKAAVPPEERKRVATLFKDFCEPGKSKVALGSAPALVKESLQGTSATDSLVKRLTGLAKESLAAKASDDGITAGDFISWYFEVAWEALKANAAAVEKKREEKKAAAADRGGAGGAGARAATGGDAGGAGPSQQSANATPLAAAAEPFGWQLGKGMHVQEYRRLMAIFVQFQRPTGNRGFVPGSQLRPLIRMALPSDDTQLLHEVMTALPTPERQSADEEPMLTVGVLVKFWFDFVWPKASRRLVEEYHLPQKT